MNKKYNLNKIFVGETFKFDNSFDKKLERKFYNYSIFSKETNDYVYRDLSDLSEIYQFDNAPLIYQLLLPGFKNCRVIYSTDKKINFVEFLKMCGITYKKNYETRDNIVKLFNEGTNILMEKNKKISRTLTIIKPDGMKNINEIIDMFNENGLKINKYDVRYLDEDLISKHYAHLLDKPFYPRLKEYMMSAPVAIMILEGENAVNKLRDLMGPTDSTKAPANTIRGKFGTDITYNAIHGSDSEENAKIEIERFFNQKQKRIIK